MDMKIFFIYREIKGLMSTLTHLNIFSIKKVRNTNTRKVRKKENKST